MNKNLKSIYEKANLLRDGQIVQIKDNWFRARRLNFHPESGTCNECRLDSICRDEIVEVCIELEKITLRDWILELANNKDRIL